MGLTQQQAIQEIENVKIQYRNDEKTYDGSTINGADVGAILNTGVP
jgi:hypothetical protein